MKQKTTRRIKKIAFGILPYFVAAVAVVTFVAVGSNRDDTAISGASIFGGNKDISVVRVTTDEFTWSFIVANLANSVNLPSVDAVNEYFLTVEFVYENERLSEGGTIEKPNIIDTSDLSRGIIEYIVQADDNIDTIAAKFGLTTNQIRWSNGMRTNAMSVGQRLFLPSIPGILYTVRVDDSLTSLAERYQSDAAQIVSYNDLEISGLVVGQTIILPNGILPERERPEYVPPTPRPSFGTISTSVSYFSIATDNLGYYSGSYRGPSIYTGGDNRMAPGNCTWFAWGWRRVHMPSNYWLPAGSIGNANMWDSSLSGGYYVDRIPRYGAVVQTSKSGYGHVGIVEHVDIDTGNVTIVEMNVGGLYRVQRRIVPPDIARQYNYIHQQRGT